MSGLNSIITDSLLEANAALESFMKTPSSMSAIEKAGKLMADTLAGGNKILSCGNGGSLCDASHFAEELTGRFRKSRQPYPALACNDPAYLTCTANDFSYKEVFSRWVEAIGNRDDILLAISTGGTSENVLMAVEKAKSIGLHVVGLTCEGETPLKKMSDICICAPKAQYSDRIQEIHIKVIHILIQVIEYELDC